MLDLKLYMLQRLSAFVMAPLAAAHIAVMIYAVQGGLSAGEILSRTQGSAAWAAFYGLFAAAAAAHAAVGLRVIAHETLGWGRGALRALTWGAFLFLFLTGARAVWAVTAGGSPS